MFPRYLGWCWDEKQSPLGPRRPVFQPPKCSVHLRGRAQGGPRLWPQAGPKWPKITKNGPRCLRGGPQKVALSKLMDKINLGTVWVAFWPCLDPCGLETASVGPKMGSFGPRMRAETERWQYLGLDGPNRESVDTFPMCKPPLVSTPQNGPNTPPQAVFAHRVPV